MNHTTRAALLLVASLFFVPACQAQTEFPDTPAAKQAKAWLDTFNAGEVNPSHVGHPKSLRARPVAQQQGVVYIHSPPDE
jgi:hypothetical protein